MPIYSSKDLVSFVNGLETKINDLNTSISEWNKNKSKILNGVGKIDGINVNAIQSLVKADEALGEISTATFTSSAARGKRLEDTLNKLKTSIFSAIENGDIIGIGSGGGELTGGMFYDELNNAIAEVDPTIEDGIKLDYRLRKIQEMSASGKAVSEKEMLLPQKIFVENPDSVFQKGFVDADQSFIEGEVTVLNEKLLPVYDANEEMITGTIDEEGQIILSSIPIGNVYLYYPVQMNFIDIPKEFGYLFFNLLLDKHSPLMSSIVKIQDVVDVLLNDLDYMKGEYWTPDFSIMKNHADLLKEAITPKGVYVDVKDGKSVLSFSYSDNEILDHFVVETLNPSTNQWEAINSNGGIVNK